MANGLDVLSLLLGQQQQQAQQSLDPASFVQSLTSPPAVQSAPVVPTAPAREDFAPGPLAKGEKGRLIGSAISDLIAQFIASKGGPQPSRSAVQQFARARRERAEREFQDALREFEQAERQRLEGREEERFERVQTERERAARVGEEQRDVDLLTRLRESDLSRNFKAEQNDLDRQLRRDIAQLQSSREGVAVARDRMQRLQTVRAKIGELFDNLDEEIQSRGPDGIRKQFEVLIDLSGLDDLERESAILLFEKHIEPALRQAEQAAAVPAEPTPALRGLAGLAPTQVGAEAGASLADVLRGAGVGPVANIGFGALPFLNNR